MKLAKLITFAITLIIAFACMAFSASAADESETTEVAIDETNFPSEILRNYLKERVDYDGNGAISQEEMPRAWDISFEFWTPEKVPDEEIPVLDLTGIDLLTKLHSLAISGYNITNADFTGCEKLEGLSLSCKKMDGLVITNLPNLERLSLSTDIFTEFKLENFQSLTSFSFTDSPELKKLEIENVPQLNILICSNDSLVSLDMDNCPALQVVNCSNNKLTKFDTSKTPSIQTLMCYGNMISELDITGCEYLIRNIKDCDPQIGNDYPIEADKSTNIKGLELTTTQASETDSIDSTVQESSAADSESQEKDNNTTTLFVVILAAIVVAGIAAAVIITKVNDGNKDRK